MTERPKRCSGIEVILGSASEANVSPSDQPLAESKREPGSTHEIVAAASWKKCKTDENLHYLKKSPHEPIARIDMMHYASCRFPLTGSIRSITRNSPRSFRHSERLPNQDETDHRASMEQFSVVNVDKAKWNPSGPPAAPAAVLYPQHFTGARRSANACEYLRDPQIQMLVTFFEEKGLSAIKEEDQREAWYEDWIAFQAANQLYARLLSPRAYSKQDSGFDLLRYTRFLEVCAYFSPAHGYSLQVTFLGLWSILMGDNADLKCEAVAALEAGRLLAFGVSEQAHGSDLLGNEFKIVETPEGRLMASGAKYYIGNSNCASIISILARNEKRHGAGRAKRAPPILFALRPEAAGGSYSVRKIRTLGVRAGFVGEFEVKDHELTQRDVIAKGRQAWNAVLGSVTLGKFFLGFGSIGIAERAFVEAIEHLCGRVLYGKPAIDIPHIRATMAQAYARLTAMKLYAYRALDYAQTVNASDRRFLLYAAVQKAKLSTEGVKVLALLSECIGARGFESDTYFEMALRDIQLIPGLEGSTHINLGLTVQFMPRYLGTPDPSMPVPGSLVAGDLSARENPYLLEARLSAIDEIAFPHFLQAYMPLMSVKNVRLFAKAANALQLVMRTRDVDRTPRADSPEILAWGRCFATIAYGQLVAESACRLNLPAPMVAAMFHALVGDFNESALNLASCSGPEAIPAMQLRRLVSTPTIAERELEFILNQMTAEGDLPWRSE